MKLQRLSASNASCVSTCETKQFVDLSSAGDEECTDCHSECATCSGAGNTECMSCSGDRVMEIRRYWDREETACVCKPGMYADADTKQCVLCGAEQYKSHAGNGACSSCPAQSKDFSNRTWCECTEDLYFFAGASDC